MPPVRFHGLVDGCHLRHGGCRWTNRSTVLPVHVAALYADRVLPGLGWPDDPDLTKVVPALLRRLS